MSDIKEVTAKFDEELDAELTRINETLDGEEREKALKNFADIYAKRMEGEKLELQKKEDSKNRWTGVGKDILLKGAEIVSMGVMVLICLRYEEEGSITSQTARNLTSKIFRK